MLDECPDLTEKFGVVCKGLGGKASLLDVGGVYNMDNPERHHVCFNLDEIKSKCKG